MPPGRAFRVVFFPAFSLSLPRQHVSLRGISPTLSYTQGKVNLHGEDLNPGGAGPLHTPLVPADLIKAFSMRGAKSTGETCRGYMPSRALTTISQALPHETAAEEAQEVLLFNFSAATVTDVLANPLAAAGC